MPEPTDTGTQAAAAGQAGGAAATAATGQAAATGTAATDAGAGGKDAILADLAKERDKRQELEGKLTAFEQSQKDQMAALAKAFGLTPDEAATGADALAKSVTDLQAQMASAQREAAILKLAAAPGVDAEGKPLPAIPAEYHHLLTATDAEALTAQAKSVAELVALKAAQSQLPGFAASAGQGQGGTPTAPLPAQIAEAEKALQGKTRGTPEYQAAAQRVASLKSQQLFAAAQSK